MPTPHFDIRLPADLKDWLSDYAEARGSTMTQVAYEVALAVSERRASFVKPERKTSRLRLRLDEGTRARLSEVAQEQESNVGEVLREALDALRQGRLVVTSSLNPNPFPSDTE